MSEKSLHLALKDWYARPGDEFEVRLGDYVIDIVRGDTLIEIQTANFTALKRKLAHLLEDHPVHLLHPIPQSRWILREQQAGTPISRRKSPKRGRTLDLFSELVYLPHLIPHQGFSLEVLLTHEEVVLRDDGKGSWRRKFWSVHDRRLLDVVAQHRFQNSEDYLAILPTDLPSPFTNQELAAALGCRPNLAQKITYTFRRAGLLTVTGKRGNANLHEV
jgi:hypothetical protein